MPEQQEPVEAYIAVGSNIEPEQNLLTALDRLKEKVPVTAVSTVYRTEPVGRPEQPSFLNGVWKILTLLPPRTLKFDVLRPLSAACAARTGMRPGRLTWIFCSTETPSFESRG